jgi:hypothetical protein
MAIYASDPAAGLPRLKPNSSKILEAILFLIEEAGRSGSYVTQFDIAKSVFVADLLHLKAYGRPVTFDNYAAMERGPVPKHTYDMLKSDYNWGPEGAPWTTLPAPEHGKRAVRYVRPVRSPNMRKLSETDASHLREALQIVKSLGFRGTSDFTHELDAYKKAWSARGSRKSNDMDYRLLVEDDGLVSDLVHASRHL